MAVRVLLHPDSLQQFAPEETHPEATSWVMDPKTHTLRILGDQRVIAEYADGSWIRVSRSDGPKVGDR